MAWPKNSLAMRFAESVPQETTRNRFALRAEHAAADLLRRVRFHIEGVELTDAAARENEDDRFRAAMPGLRLGVRAARQGEEAP